MILMINKRIIYLHIRPLYCPSFFIYFNCITALMIVSHCPVMDYISLIKYATLLSKSKYIHNIRLIRKFCCISIKEISFIILFKIYIN